MEASVAALDCGLSGVAAGLFGLDGTSRAVARRELPSRTGASGHVEQDGAVVVAAALDALGEALARSRASPAGVLAVSLATRGAVMGCIGPDGDLAGPLASSRDGQESPLVEGLRDAFPPGEFHARTGLPPGAAFPVGWLLWLRAREPSEVRRAARFALLPDLLLGALGASDPVVDESTAAMTGLFEVATRRWCPRVLDALDLDAARLPAVVAPGRRVGQVSAAVAARTGLVAGTPLVAGAGDRSCAGLAAAAVRPGRVAVLLGRDATTLAVLPRPILDPAATLRTGVHVVPGTWDLEGVQACAGSAIEWACTTLGLDRPAPEELDRRLGTVPPGSRGVLFLPLRAGGGTFPHGEPDATGAFLGLRAGRGRDDLLRAVAEGVAFETRRILDGFRDLGVPVEEIRASGRLARVESMARILADVAGVPVRALRGPDAALLGAAMVAAAGAGAWPSVEAAADAMTALDDEVRPEPARTEACDRARRAAGEALGALGRSGAFHAIRRVGDEG